MSAEDGSDVSGGHCGLADIHQALAAGTPERGADRRPLQSSSACECALPGTQKWFSRA